jgi:hypothetical protein
MAIEYDLILVTCFICLIEVLEIHKRLKNEIPTGIQKARMLELTKKLSSCCTTLPQPSTYDPQCVVPPVVSRASKSGNIMVLRSSLFVLQAAYNKIQSDLDRYSTFHRAIAYCATDMSGINSLSTTWLLKSSVTTTLIVEDFCGLFFLAPLVKAASGS